ncbi:MAG: cytochrome b N-terminal domain-containing protein [Desulforhopalus sp.]
MISRPSHETSHFSRGFLLHIHPKKVAKETLRISLCFGLGGMSATLLFLLFITGIFQVLSYIPDIGGAYDSVNMMYENASLAGWTRNIHYWSGNLLVIVALLHCCRVFLTGALHAQRGLNWHIGLILLGLVLLANFSGYLLPWDQLAYWAVTIFTSMLGYIPVFGEDIVELLRGGKEIGPSTLSIFYAIHTGILPFCFVVAGIYHFWLVRKAGGLVRTQDNSGKPPDFVPAVPNLIEREAAVAFIVIAIMLLFASLVDAPLAERANPAMSPNPAKAAWFFLGFQELLIHLHPTYAIVVLPSLFLTCLVLIPFRQDMVLPGGHWFGGGRGKKLAIWSCLAGTAITFIVILIDEQLKTTGTNTSTDILSRGIVPVLVIAALYGASYLVITGKLGFTRAQAVMAGFVFTLTSLSCLTIVASWLRGAGMKLLLPF